MLAESRGRGEHTSVLVLAVLIVSMQAAAAAVIFVLLASCCEFVSVVEIDIPMKLLVALLSSCNSSISLLASL